MFPYPGGKSKISKWIVPYFPQDSLVYVEPFSGAFWVYMKWNISPQTVVYNDLNKHLANLFSCFVTNPKQLADRMSQVPSENVEVFVKFRDALFTELGGMTPDIEFPDFEIATVFSYLLTHHFIGHKITPTLRYQHIDTVKWSSRYQALIRKLQNPKIVNRLSTITNIENIGFKEVILKYDSKDTFFYVDPPYWNTEHYYTEGEFNEYDHEQLSSILKNIKGKFALSYYEFSKLHEWYPQNLFNWQFKEFTSPMSTGANLARVQQGHGNKVDVSKHKSTEILIMNY